MSFLLASAARASTGARSGQEDAFRLWPTEGVAKPDAESGGLLAVLADGMGGHTGGAVAGQTACTTFTETFAGINSPYDQRLQTALHASNEALARGVEQNASLRGMGCTLVAAWMDTVGIRWASVGDSLLLLYRFPDVIRLNADHSLGFFLDEQARQNRISTSEAKNHHNRNALRSALTGSKIDLIDLRGEPLELRAGDWILLASDGICSLEGDEIADVIYNFRESAPEQMADGLIAAVAKKGVAGQDNTTVVAVRVDEAPAPGADLPTRRIRTRGDEELRSRRIGMTGRKTASRRLSHSPMRTAVWLVAAAVFFLFFAVTVAMRVLQPAVVSNPAADTVRPTGPMPAAVVTPEPATSDNPDPASQDPQRPQGPPGPQGASEGTAPEKTQLPGVPVPPRGATPPPQKAGQTPTPQRPAPAARQPSTPPAATPEAQPSSPAPAPGAQPSSPPGAAPPGGQPGTPPGTQSGTPSGEAKEASSPRGEKVKPIRREREPAKRVAPREPVRVAPREPSRPALPQGFGE